ncbi:hypothetical protein U1Q18_018242 [Sarracenia purpurea var. burkii]
MATHNLAVIVKNSSNGEEFLLVKQSPSPKPRDEENNLYVDCRRRRIAFGEGLCKWISLGGDLSCPLDVKPSSGRARSLVVIGHINDSIQYSKFKILPTLNLQEYPPEGSFVYHESALTVDPGARLKCTKSSRT